MANGSYFSRKMSGKTDQEPRTTQSYFSKKMQSEKDLAAQAAQRERAQTTVSPTDFQKLERIVPEPTTKPSTSSMMGGISAPTEDVSAGIYQAPGTQLATEPKDSLKERRLLGHSVKSGFEQFNIAGYKGLQQAGEITAGRMAQEPSRFEPKALKPLREGIQKVGEYMSQPSQQGQRLQEEAAVTQEKVSQEIAKADDPQLAQLRSDVYSGLGQSVPSMLFGPAGLITQGFGAFGTKAEEAQQAGATLKQRLLAGTLEGVKEIATELPSYLTGAKFLRGQGKLIDVGNEAIEEGLGEAVSTALSPFISKIYDEDALDINPIDLVNESIYSGLVGAASGTLMAGGLMNLQSARNYVSNPTEENLNLITKEIKDTTGVDISQVLSENPQDVEKIQQNMQKAQEIAQPVSKAMDTPDGTITPVEPETASIEELGTVGDDVGYHFGDLGKSEGLGNMGPGRNTGHFGTGTYFVGDQTFAEGQGYSDRPMQTVSFADYNLYKPTTQSEGQSLHDLLKSVNDTWNQPEVYSQELFDAKVQELQERADDLEITGEEAAVIEQELNDLEDARDDITRLSNRTKLGQEVVEQYVNELREDIRSEFGTTDLYLNNNARDSDSASTRLMKKAGYEGVDVRGIKGLDNFEKGSVIYDLRESQPDTTEGLTPEAVELEVQRITESEYDTDADIANAIRRIEEYENMVGTGKLRMNLQTFADAKKILEMKQSQTVDTLGRAPIIEEEFSDVLQQDAEQGLFNYEQHVDKDIRSKAQSKVRKNEAAALEEFLKKDSMKTDEDVALAHELIRKAVNRKDIDTYRMLVSNYVQKSSTMGQAFRALNWITLMDSAGMLNYAYRQMNSDKTLKKYDKGTTSVKDIIEGKGTTEEKAEKLRKYFKKELSPKQRITKKQFIDQLINGLEEGKISDAWLRDNLKSIFGIQELSTADSEAIIDLMERAKEMEQGRERDKVIAEAFSIIGKNIPSTLTEKVASLQRTSMLFNIATNVRNVGGNVGMLGMELATEQARVPVDIVTSMITGERITTRYKREDFTKANTAAGQGLYYAYDDWRAGINTRADMGQFEISNNRVWDEDVQNPALRKVAKGLNAVDNLTTFALSAGDRPFYEYHKALEMSRLSRVEKYASDTALLEETAHEIALDRTFQNKSVLAQKASQARNVFGVFGRFVMPFSYTPANIADKIFDYTPAGVIRSLGKNVIWDQYISKDGSFNQQEFTTRLSRNLTGTAIIGLGYALAKAGLIGGAYDEDDKVAKFQKSIGMQDYAFNVNGRQYTFDWAQPAAVPLGVGANLWQQRVPEATWKQAIWDAMMTSNVETSNILLEQPLLTGFRRLFQGYGTESFAQNIVGLLKEAPVQLVPGMSLARTIRKIADPVVRNIDYSSSMERIGNQIPGISQNFPAKYTPFGEEVTYADSLAERLIEPVLSPGYLSGQLTPIEQLYLDVYDEVGDTDIFPSVPGSYQKQKLTKEEESWFNETQGQYISAYIAQYDPNILLTADKENLSELLVGLSKDANDYTKKLLEQRRKGISE